jgi:hypothetical protein
VDVWCGVVCMEQFSLGPGQGMVTLRARLAGTDVVSNAVTYGYSSGSVDSVTPGVGDASGGAVVVISGQNLGVTLWNVTEQGCVAENAVWLGPWRCSVLEVRVTRCTGCACSMLVVL